MYSSLLVVFILNATPLVLQSSALDNLRGKTTYLLNSIAHRLKRDTICGPLFDNYRCRDGTCISSDTICDGVANCDDGSDETHHLCRKTECPSYLFRCTYGACVDGDSICNGKRNCIDNSDELQPPCNNKTYVYGDQFKCDDGTYIEVYRRCDGTPDCKDRSDETLRACVNNICPTNLFQCAYGACIDEGAECNDIDDCADGSDESDVLCNRKVPRTTTTTTTTTSTPSTTTVEAPVKCILPRHPKYGLFVLNGGTDEYKLGEALDFFSLNITCTPGYVAVGESPVICVDGTWSRYELPFCERACTLNTSDSVVYLCLVSGTGVENTRPCGQLEPQGTTVVPECRQPNYFSRTVLPYMFCIDGRWNCIPTCEPECGTLIPKGEALIAGGTLAYRGEVPWHAGIYIKIDDNHEQICGGSLLAENIFISAAHCFWNEIPGQLFAPHHFAVAVGKLYREWDSEADEPYAQKSEVKDITVAPRFGGADLFFQNDIALLITYDKFSYRPYIRPVCYDFLPKFYNNQMKYGSVGKVAGWGLTTGRTGSESAELKVLDMPYVRWDDCVSRTPSQYRNFLVGGKFCAGYGNGTTVCKGDSGGGLAFPATSQGKLRYYLRGVVSTAPHSPIGTCNLHALAAFAEIQPYEAFIRNITTTPR